MQRWSLRKLLISAILAVIAFALPWQQMLHRWFLPPSLADMSADPAERERQLRSAVIRLDALGNVLPYGRGGIYVELARIEADRNNHAAADRLYRKGLQFEPQPLDVRLAMVESAARAGGDDNRALAAALLHDVSRFAQPHEAGQIMAAAARLNLPQPFTAYREPRVTLGKPVLVVALGDVPMRTVESISRKIEAAVGTEVVVRADPAFTPSGKNRLSHAHLQFEADDLAKSIGAMHAETLDNQAFSARLMIVDADIYAAGLNFIYATVTASGASLISTFRFRDPSDDLMRIRGTKQALTSVLDQLAGERPSHSSCVNANSDGQMTFDLKSDVICSETLLAIARRQTTPAAINRSAKR